MNVNYKLQGGAMLKLRHISLSSAFSLLRACAHIRAYCSLTPITLVVAVSVLGIGPVGAASFDCEKAVTKVERLICSDPRLSGMDTELHGAYRKARESERLLNNRDNLRERQIVWLRDIRDRCLDLECLRSVYEQRIMQLKVPLQPDNCAGADQGVMAAIVNCSSSEWLMEEDYLSNLILILTKTRIDSKVLNFEKKQTAWRKNIECHCWSKAHGYSSSASAAMVIGCRLEEVKIRITEVKQILNGLPLSFGGNSPPLDACSEKDVKD